MKIKQTMKNILKLAGASAIIFAMALSVPHTAWAANDGIPQFGSVDLQQIMTGDTKKAAFDSQIQNEQQLLAGYFQEQSTYPMLSEADQTQLGALLAKTPQTDSDLATIKQLEQKSSDANQQLMALQNNANPTADQQAQMKQLLQLKSDGDAALKDVQANYQTQLQQLSDKLSAQLSDQVKAAISTVAKQKGLAVVFDSQVAIYTANDVTADVLKVLNK